MPFHIKTPKTLENKGFRRYYLARQKGFEPPAFPLGELLNNCHTCSPLSLDVYPLKLAVLSAKIQPQSN